MKTYIICFFILVLNLNSQWYSQNSGVTYALGDVFFANENTGYAVGIVVNSNQILKTTNGGTNWFIVSVLPVNSEIVTVYFVNENTGWVAGLGQMIHTNGEVFKTTNGGINWILQIGIYECYFSDLVFFNENTGFAFGFINQSGLNSVIRKTIDGGNSWTTPGNIGQNSPIQRCSFINSNTGLICTDLKIYKTTDSGINWFQPSTGTFSGLNSVCFLDSNTSWLGSNSGIFKTTNGGVNWINQNAGTIQYPSITFTNPFMGWAVGVNGVIKYTSNGGNNWFNYLSGITNDLYSIFFVNSLKGWIVGSSGKILHTDNNGGVTGIKKMNDVIPANFSISQNYPNPFNPVTKIVFDVPQKSYVRLSVFDVLGKEVARLVDVNVAPGQYETQWDASEMPSGVYFYSLLGRQAGFTAGDYSQTKKMILVK